jgi:hypothetical protein
MLGFRVGKSGATGEMTMRTILATVGTSLLTHTRRNRYVEQPIWNGDRGE